MLISTGKRLGHRTALIVYQRPEEKEVLEMMLALSELRYLVETKLDPEVTTRCDPSSQETSPPTRTGT